jgi:transcriptional regulator with XRE-family HTH domain
MEEIGKRVFDARNRKLWTQRELSDASGVMEATISRIENGRYKRRPTNDTLKALATALDVTVFWLVFGEDEGKASARIDRAEAGVPDTSSYLVEDDHILKDAA